MANNPQPKDPTEQALNAIEEALRFNDEVQRPAPEQPPLRHEDPPLRHEAGAPPAPTDLFVEEPHPWTGDEAPLRPANDDRATIGQILQTLRRRPNRTPYLVATVASVVWAAGAVAAAFLYSGRLLALIGTPNVGFAATIALAAGFVVPIIFFYVLAHLVRRSQDLRLVAESIGEVAMRLAQPETVGHDAVVTVGQAVRREVAAMGDGIERALARAGELEALVHNEVSALERTYSDNEVRMRDLLAELASQRETLVAQAEQVRNAIASVHLDLANDITSVGDLVADKVNEVAVRVTRSLTEKGEHIALALGHAGDNMIDLLGERGATLLDRLENTSERATGAISTASERLTSSLTFKTETVHNEFAELAVSLQKMMSARLESVAQGFAKNTAQTIETLATRSQAFTAAIDDTSAHLSDTLRSRSDEVAAMLRSTGQTLVDDITLRSTDAVAQMEQTGASVAQGFRENTATLVDTLNSRGDAVRDILASRLQDFENVFQHSGTALSEKIGRDTATLGGLITRSLAEFDHTVKTYGGELVERMGARATDVGEAMRLYIDGFDESVGARTTEFNSNLDQRISQFDGMLTMRVGEVTGTIAAKSEEIDHTLGQRAEEIAGNIDTRIGRFEELLVGRAEAVTTGIEIRTRAAAEALNARVIELSQAIKSNSEDAEESLGALARSTSEAIRASAEAAERSLTGASQQTARSLAEASQEAARSLTTAGEQAATGFTGKAAEIAEAVTRHTGEITAALSDQSHGVIAALGEKGHEFAGAISGATEEAMRSIEQRGQAFTRSMVDNGNEIARLINVAGETAATAVTRTVNTLHETTRDVIERSQQTATASVKEILETHDMVRADTTALFERLREANIMLQEVLSGAHENMSGLENTLMLRVSEFVTAMSDVTASTNEVTNRVESNITAFRQVTTRLVTDLGELASQFQAHARDLGQAIEMIDHSNKHTEDAVNTRRSQLEALSASLDARTQDIEQRLGRFFTLLDESLEAASTRTREVARVVSETSAAGTRAIAEQYAQVRDNAEDVARVVTDASRESARNIGEQFERVRQNAQEVARLVTESSAESTRIMSDQFARIRESTEDERRRASADMEAVFERVNSDAGAVFAQASERFADVVQAMKAMATEMQRELESTRAELRRGIFDLPQETAASAAQMRRVIVDQIEALAELNRIVARHGRSLDAVEPLRRPAREEPTLNLAASRSEAPPRPARPRDDIAAGFAPLPRRPEPVPPPPREESAASFAPPPRQPEPRQPETPPAAGAVPGPGRGWLTDLLNRASRESEEPPPRENAREPTREPPRTSDERTPRHSIESLDSLSVDIARMIDHEAATDLWDRYKRGERNVFTRRLYTLHGQKAFDEIRRKYRADREFRQTVDRYIAEFERLLEEVSRDDRDQMVARTYLTSETGKVYTMLAHAAGRFE